VQDLELEVQNTLLLMDAHQSEEHTFQPQNHNAKFVTKKGFHADGYIDGSLNSSMRKCGLINILRKMYEGIMTNIHTHGSIHIDLSEHVADIGLLDISVLKSDQCCHMGHAERVMPYGVDRHSSLPKIRTLGQFTHL
jgi:hypothetical protein